ncbi:MAG: sodium:solute symporter family protein [Chlamydiia bacterium]|nr:sodium:solute symporter family protein [Chlamydiia bacterium]
MTLLFGIGAYLVFLLSIGAVAGRKVKTVEDYLVAKRRLPFFMAVPTIVATWFGAGSCMGVSGTVHRGSFYEVIADPFACSCGLVIAGLFFAARFRRTEKFTISDVLGKAYGKQVERFSSLLMLPFYVGTLASQMLALGVIFHIATGLDMQMGILIGSAIVVLYTMAGGMWAVSCTDFVQLALLIVGLTLLFTITWRSAPLQETLPQFWHEFSELKPQSLGLFPFLAFIGQLLMTGLGAIMGQDLIQRFFSCRTEKVAKWSTITAGGGYFALGLIPLFIGVAGRALYPHLSASDQLLPQLARDHLSTFTFSLFAAGLIAAIMSTADSYLLAGTAILTQNIFKTKNLKMMRASNLIIAAVSFTVAMFSKSIFNLMVHSGATLFVSIFVPTALALYGKKANNYPLAAWTSMLSGLVGWLGWLFLIKPHVLSFEEHLFAAATVGGIASLCGYYVPVVTRYTHSTLRIGISAAPKPRA